MTDAHTKIDQTESRIRDGYETVRETASKVYHDASDKAADALVASRETAKRTVNNLETHPLGILVGGVAVGALVGALIPRSAREKQLLAPLGKRIGETALAAVAAAKAAGQSELGELGLTKDNARGQAKGLVDGLVKAATTAGTAGAKAVSQKPTN